MERIIEEHKDSKNISTISTHSTFSKSGSKLRQSVVENGTITGIGSVTNIQTWLDTLRTPKVTYGEGKYLEDNNYPRSMKRRYEH